MTGSKAAVKTEGVSSSANAAAMVLTQAARVAYISVFLLGLCYYDYLQQLIDGLYSYLLSTWVFNSVYFETWWATVVYAPILFVPFTMDILGIFNSYKIDPKLQWESAGLKKILLEAVEYCAPLMLLDTFMVKKYSGVDPSEWTMRRRTFMQSTRALPELPPTVFQIVYHILCSFIIYDAIFYAVHFLLHKNMWLYKHLHSSHHEHPIMHSRVTNQLSVTERIILVLSANEALKIMGSHPLTRAIFVPLFVGWLVENHCGYNFPWTLDKVVPFGLVGGSPTHYKHHMLGSRHYQPFFSYIDAFVNRKTKNAHVS